MPILTRANKSSRARSLKISKVPLAYTFLALAISLTIAAPQSAFALHRVVPHRHRILHTFRFLGLPGIQDDDELEALKASRELVPIETGETLRIDPRLDPSRRFCRPWTRDFVTDLSELYYREFHGQIQLNSAVRTVKVQQKLRRHNRNAAPADGDTASSHLAGITLDLQRRGMSKQQVHFVERYLFYLRALGLVEPEEERHQWVFHVMVSERYTNWRQTQDVAHWENQPFEELSQK